MEAVKAVLARRDRLFDAVASSAGPGVLGGDGVARAADAAAGELPRSCRYDAVYRTLLPAVSQDAASPVVRDLCWALAANISRLRDGQSVAPGVFDPGESKVVVQFVAAARTFSRRTDGSPGFPVRYRARVLVGPGAPATLEVTWSSRFVAYFATQPRGLGFARRDKPGRHYLHYSTLVGMRAVSVVAPGARGPRITKSSCPAGLRKFNRAVTEMRYRAGFECPFGYDHHCHVCPKGQSSCPAAVRQLDLVEQVCTVCHSPSAHDVAWSSRVCVNCRATGRRSSES